ncbi:hypothetical protein PVAND_009859 [Polypedilum vanderplanki]|uniref:Leucine rich repeat protein n=1 Tax=Polypedilum vanderplanki TaxID=319348 RepID=A0A9J6CEJ0_POLVA|nr:hypothetical protein PVAND_009859 [Polypedilum vanderplanki]
MKFIGLAVLICCFSTFTVGNSVTIKCYYQMWKYWEANGIEYQCKVQNNEIFNENRVTIEKAEGEHKNGKSDDDVKFFVITGAKLQFFPRNLENVFKNLELIFIWNSKLIEITSEDLKPFPKLKSFKLEENPIEVIREDLFINNPDLEVLYLENNKINHIDPKALSHLNKLRAIWFKNNLCKFDKSEVTTRSEVLQIVKKIEQGQCLSTQYAITVLFSQNYQLKQQNEEILKKLNENQKYNKIIENLVETIQELKDKI